jgi:NhaP-type Na+/H+ or K+/H+ antiporter
MINKKINGMSTGSKQYFYFLSNLIVNTAFILTGLTIVGIDITVFVEVYKIILLTVGITISLIIGIPIGVYISNKINNKQKKTKFAKK